METWVEDFVAYLRYERNYSEGTIRPYHDSLEEFGQFIKSLDQELCWSDVTTDIVRDWIVSLMDRGMSAAGVCPKLSAVKSFYRFLLRRGLVETDPAHLVPSPRKAKVLPYFVREKDMDHLLDDIPFPDTFEGLRNRLILVMLYTTGMRASELLGLNVSDVDCMEHQLTVLGKRNKQRIIPYGQELSEALDAYFCVRESSMKDGWDKEAIFLNPHRGTRISYALLRNVVRDNLSKVTLQQKRSPHVLRHSFATSMLNHEADLESVKELLGHEALTTTAIYTHTTFEELKKTYNRAHPRA